MKELLLFAIFFTFILPCFSETIKLKSGKSVEAKIVEKTESRIKVDISGIPITYYLDEIESIDGVKEISSSMSRNNFPTNSKNAVETFDKKTGDSEKEKRDIYVDEIFTNGTETYVLLLNSGLEYFNKRDYDKAIYEFTKAIALNPNLPEAYTCRGNVYLHKENYDQAISDYNKAIEINPNYTLAYSNRGVAYRDQGNLPQAISDYNKAIEINPNLAEAYNNRGNAYFDQKDFAKALEDIHKAKSLGYRVNPRFLEELKKASGKEK